MRGRLTFKQEVPVIIKRFGGKIDLGSVGVYIISLEMALLVMDPSKRRADRVAFWKLPVGGIETTDVLTEAEARIVIETNRATLPQGVSIERLLQVVAGARREGREETGVDLAFNEILFLEQERRERREDGGETYYPNLCLAMVSDKKIRTYRPINDEDGKPIKAALFERTEVPEMGDQLSPHRPFIKKVEALLK